MSRRRDEFGSFDGSGRDEFDGEPGGSKAGREPLHQPPNPEDLRRIPPAGPECARVRGLLRDYSDGDLDEVLGKVVEEHVHGCRVCAVELARSEHEVLRLRRGFQSLGAVEPELPADFASRMVELVVLAEPGLAEPGHAGAMSGDDGAPRDADERDIALASPAGMFVAALFALFLLVLGVRVFADLESEPERKDHLVVVVANDAIDGRKKPLTAGDSLGDSQRLWVRRGGAARLEWHDRSARAQPAATLDVEDGELLMQGGAPLLLDGRVVVETHRGVEIPMADGSSVALGKGEYVIAAELPADMLADELWAPGEDPLAAMAQRARIEVQVRSGQPARILRGGGAPTLVAVGQVASYDGGGGPVMVGPYGPVAGVDEVGERMLPPSPTAAAELGLSGTARLPNNLPSVGSNVVLWYACDGDVLWDAATSGADGRFSVSLEDELGSDFAIVMALPNPARRDLGMVVRQALPVDRQSGQAQLGRPIVFEPSLPVGGVIRDQLQQLRPGVQVVPCLVDELFGKVLALPCVDEHGMQVSTGPSGAFELDRLPTRLLAHQHLVLVLSGPGLEPTVVPVPQRGSAAALAETNAFTARTLRLVRLGGLAPNATVHLLEEVPGLPPGSAAVRRIVQTNAVGEVFWASVGSGRLWWRWSAGSNILVRELVLDEGGPLPRYVPGGDVVPYRERFLTMQELADTGVLVSESYRHREFVVSAGENVVTAQALRVLDHAGWLVAGAEVFATRHTGARGLLTTRFLGFTSQSGVMPLGTVAPDEDVFVIAPDGGIGFRERPTDPANGMAVNLQVARTGRVLLSSELQPPATEPNRVVTIRFRRNPDELLPGMEPVAVRFATDDGQWEVGGLPAGNYTAEIDGQQYPVFVPPGGFVVLQP